MSNQKKNDNLERLKKVLSIDKKEVEKTTQENEKEIDIIEGCRNFCSRYNIADFGSLELNQLRDICEEGTGLLNNYYITNKEIQDSMIIQLQYIIMSASHNLHVKEIRNTKIKMEEIKKELDNNMNSAVKIKEDNKETTEEVKHLKDDMKSIVTVIISIVLTISIIPTAIAGIERINPNYILPFLSSIILFGIVMIIFVYSIYQDKIKKSTWIILIISLVLCIFLWILSFNINIENITNIEESKENKIEQNEIIKDLNDKKENANNKK